MKENHRKIHQLEIKFDQIGKSATFQNKGSNVSITNTLQLNKEMKKYFPVKNQNAMITIEKKLKEDARFAQDVVRIFHILIFKSPIG